MGEHNMVNVKKDLTGQVFGRLTVLYQTNDYIAPYGKHCDNWMCLCSCGKKFPVLGMRLKSGKTKSCGCYKLDSLKKKNVYDLSGEFGICYNAEMTSFCYFDKEDYELIQPYYWSSDGRYWETGDPITKNKLRMHRFILKLGQSNRKDDYVDHINGKKYDNRKENLRICTPSQNLINRKTPSNNTSGVKGVCFSKKDQLWRAQIGVNGKSIYLGSYKDKNDAIQARKEAEEKYYKGFNPIEY